MIVADVRKTRWRFCKLLKTFGVITVQLCAVYSCDNSSVVDVVACTPDWWK